MKSKVAKKVTTSAKKPRSLFGYKFYKVVQRGKNIVGFIQVQ